MLPGADSAAGKAAYTIAAVLVVGFCLVRMTSSCGKRGQLEEPTYTLVCDKCGEVQKDRTLDKNADGSIKLPAKCNKCGEMAAYLIFTCPHCGKTIPLDPKHPPKTCKFCEKDLQGIME